MGGSYKAKILESQQQRRMEVIIYHTKKLGKSTYDSWDIDGGRGGQLGPRMKVQRAVESNHKSHTVTQNCRAHSFLVRLLFAV